MKPIETKQSLHGIINRVEYSMFRYQGWPTVTKDENGVLYAVASGFRISHICPFGKTVLYVSFDQGKTWTPPTIINDTYLDDRDAGILYMGNGRMLVTWFTHSAKAYHTRYKQPIEKWTPSFAKNTVAGALADYEFLPEEERLAGSYIRISEDYGRTWGERIRIPISAPHGPTLCRDGSLIYLGREQYCEDREAIRTTKSTVALYRSLDGGYTWNEESTVPSPNWLAEGERLEEPHVLELPNGNLLGAFRVGGRKPFSIATSVSKDGGKTWQEVICTGVSGSPPHLMLHSSGAIICSYGRREEPFGERAMVSRDMGETWSEEYTLSVHPSSADLGYPSTVELEDKSLITVYYQRYGDDKYPSILYTKWSL